MSMRFFSSVLVLGSLIALAGCSSTKEKLGLNKQSPDEFKVLKRAPLALPPDYALRPPVPGAPRPQEQTTAQEAAQTVFGASQAQPASASDASAMLLQQAGADAADPNIRASLNQEVDALNKTNESVAEKLVGLGGFGNDKPPASVVDAAKEAERLKQNAEGGKPVTEGETPVIEE